MTYIRPEDVQIDAWEAFGNPGWNWASLYPYFKRSETFQIPSIQQQVNGAAYDPKVHGFNGPIDVSFNPTLLGGDIHSIINQTWNNLGLPWRREVNGGKLRGFTIWPQTLDSTADVRQDAARVYYFPISGRPNLALYLNTTASKIIWDEKSRSSALTATGVEIVSADGSLQTLFADKEVIVSTGSLRTPVLLERSGVGNPK
jgi:choline dehydrogenase-like flavoprotein